MTFCLRQETCAYIPGCSTSTGETAYGGWCSSQVGHCAHLDKESCLATKASMKKSTTSTKCNWKNAVSETSCSGDRGRWQNPGCSFTNDREACMWMPGCNWAGENHFGGWCVGDLPRCAMQTSKSTCGDECQWHSQT